MFDFFLSYQLPVGVEATWKGFGMPLGSCCDGRDTTQVKLPQGTLASFRILPICHLSLLLHPALGDRSPSPAPASFLCSMKSLVWAGAGAVCPTPVYRIQDPKFTCPY